jgi:hypothetical protein
MMDFSSILAGVAPFLEEVAPTIASLVGGPLAGDAVTALEKVCGLQPGTATAATLSTAVQQLTGDQIVALKQADNALAIRKLELEHGDTLASIQQDLQQVQAVNATMQAEAQARAAAATAGKPESWWITGWRPACGWVIAVASLMLVAGVLVLTYMAIVDHDATAMNAIAGVVFSVTSALAIPGAAAGITAWHRGMLQRQQGGDQP